MPSLPLAFDASSIFIQPRMSDSLRNGQMLNRRQSQETGPGYVGQCAPGTCGGVTRLELIWVLVAALGLTVAMTVLPQRVANTDLDSSWKLVLTYAHDHSLKWGQDIVFTFGPLGFLFTPVFTGVSFGIWLLALLLLNYLLAIGMCLWCRRLSWIWRLVFVCLLAGVFISLDTKFDIGLVCWGLLCVAGPEPQAKWSCPLLALVIAVLSLWKFNLLLVGAATSLCVGACLALRGRRVECLQVLCLPIVLFIVGWLALGQGLASICVYCSTSLLVSNGYNLAMALSPPVGVLIFGILVAALVLVAIWLHTVAFPQHEFSRLIKFVAFVWILSVSFLAWKHGFTRAPGHEIIFFGFAALLVVVVQGLPVTGPTALVLSRVTAGVAIALACLASEWDHPGLLKARAVEACGRIPANVGAIFHHERAAEQFTEALSKESEAAQLPRTSALIGKATVDVFGENQAFAVFNGLNYHPRPVFQSYIAFTPSLVRLNQRFYEGSSAPEFVLFNLTPLDRRPSTLEDSGALRSLFTAYRPVEAEGRFVIFKRTNEQAARLTLVFEGSARFNDRIDLNRFRDGDLWMQVVLRPTVLGALRQFLYQPAEVALRTWPASVLQSPIQFHAPAAMLASPFLIKPFLADTLDAVDLYTGQSNSALAAISLETSSGKSAFYRQPFHFRIYRLEPPLKRQADPTLVSLGWPGFRTFPCESMAPLNPICLTTVGSESAIRVCPGAYLKFCLSPGATRVQGAYGFEESAYLEGTTDGAEFRVELEAEDGSTRLLHSELLLPRTKPTDRGLHRFEVKLPAGASGKIVLRATPGPANDATWDLTCWSGIRID